MGCSTKRLVVALVAAAGMVTAACGSGSGGGSTEASATGGAGGPASQASSGTQSGSPQHGGTLTYLVSGLLASWTRGLDPASAGAAPSMMEDAIFGQLFRPGHDGKIEPMMASGYKVSDDGKTVTITLRKGLKFTDGTPLDAEAVQWNIRRDLSTPCTCSPVTSWPPLVKGDNGITTPDEHTVVLHFTAPYAPAINAIIGSSVNHIASPTAVKKMGEKKFALKPVGAGPFTLVKNVVDTQLTLERNPDYFREGLPYLDRLIFKAVADDQTAYQAMQAGQGQAAQITSASLAVQVKKNPDMSVTIAKGTSPLVIQLNTAIPPFNNKLAREAIYYATNSKAIEHLYHGLFPVVQSFLGPGGLFYEPTVPGYRTYDLAKAKALVSQLGGLEVDLFGGNDAASTQTLTALQTEWREAGMKVTIHPYTLDRMIQEFGGKKWQAALQTNGAYDPGVSNGVPFRFRSTAQYSGVHDTKLDAMMNRAVSTLDPDKRATLYHSMVKYISDNAYAPFLVAAAPIAIAVTGVHGPGLTEGVPMPSVVLPPWWDEVWVGKS